MIAADLATVRALRADLALQIARRLQHRGLSQAAAARFLDIPQPTLSCIVNARVDGLSLELLIRIAVRARLGVVMQTGDMPEEAGVYMPQGRSALPPVRRASKLSEQARREMLDAARAMTPEQRLDAVLEQSRLVGELHAAGNARRTRQGRSRPRP